MTNQPSNLEAQLEAQEEQAIAAADTMERLEETSSLPGKKGQSALLRSMG